MSDMDTQEETVVELPPGMSISKFSAARSNEIAVLKKALLTSSGAKLAFQKLPKHMRRRIMSHNVKRLPRRLREIHMNQMKKSGMCLEQKRTSRKYRRRPYNLTSDYMRRQRRCMWLNTHIWHAKRFHMVEKWGYKLPYAPCDKAFRACYRATVNHCLLQDISYYACIEIIGEYDHIVNSFKKITNPITGLTIGAKAYASGLREGSVTIFYAENYEKAIGIVNFLWRPAAGNKKRTLWLWLHAAFYEDALANLIHCFNFSTNSEIDGNLSYVNSDTTELLVRKFELNRFRLTGLLSSAIISNAFKTMKDASAEWVKEYERNAKISKEFLETLKCTSSSEISPHIAVPLIISDPRFNLPKMRTKSMIMNSDSTSSVSFSNDPVDSPLWNSNIRKVVEDSKISNAKIAEWRSDLLVPGSDLEQSSVPIPIILVHRPGVKCKELNGYGSGWDIILPSKWSQPIWISLIMWSARVGGLRETNSIAFESNDQAFLYPDTIAGAEEEQNMTNKCKEIYFKLPPNKRTNYNKFRIASPLEMNWRVLMADWSTDPKAIVNYYVLRDKTKLKSIQDFLKYKPKSGIPDFPENYLIPVSITLSAKGCCKRFAIICIPKYADIKKEPTEVNANDPNERQRKFLRKYHKAMLKRLRKRRVIAKRNGKVPKRSRPIDEESLKMYTEKMRALWLPETKNVRHSCSREVIGFVKHGDFSFCVGQSKAIGYVTAGGLRELLLQKHPDRVLVRNNNTRQYRLGSLQIIC